VLKHSLVPTTPFLSLETFPWVGRMEAMVPVVRAELDEVLSHRESCPISRTFP